MARANVTGRLTTQVQRQMPNGAAGAQAAAVTSGICSLQRMVRLTCAWNGDVHGAGESFESGVEWRLRLSEATNRVTC